MSEGRGDPFARRAAEVLRQEVPDERGLEAVLAAVRADAASSVEVDTPTPSTRAAAPAFFSRLTPWTALIAATLVFAAGLGTGALLRGGARRGGATIASSDSVTSVPHQGRVVEFVLVAPSASRVSLVGEFNGWDAKATPMRVVSGRGTWSVSVPLTEGRHVYAFVVDDSTWVPDPQAPLAPEQWYGERNSVVVVPATGGPRT